MGRYDGKPHMLVGKKILRVYLADDNQAIRFDLEGGETVIACCDGDCCSHTWIESVEGPERAIGTVTEALDIDMPTPAGYDSQGQKEGDDYGDEYITFYGFRIRTERGDFVLDYRNSSNGYYGGSLTWPDDGYYYGGVFGQNKSTQQWKLIAGVEEPQTDERTTPEEVGH